MTAFGAAQGGKAKAHESKPVEGVENPAGAESPRGEIKKPQVDKGVGGSRKGFGA